jgi:hypothetical protein
VYHVIALSGVSFTSPVFFHLCMAKNVQGLQRLRLWRRLWLRWMWGGWSRARKSGGERRVLGVEGEVQGRHKSSGEGEGEGEGGWRMEAERIQKRKKEEQTEYQAKIHMYTTIPPVAAWWCGFLHIWLV